MLINLIKRFTSVTLFFYSLLTIRSIIKRHIFKNNLKTGDRKNTTSNFIKYIEFCNENLISKIKNLKNIESALEVGPGDNHAISIMVKHLKITKVYTVDKFQKFFDDETNYPLYEEMSKYFKIGHWKKNAKNIRRLNQDLGINDLIEIKNQKFDLIFSVSVLEHLWPWKSYLAYMSNLLNPNGKMVHIVNFTDHGMFSPQNNRFIFRSIPDFIYNPIMAPVGRPNRILPSDIINFFQTKGFEVNMDVVRTHTRELNLKEKFKLENIPLEEINELLKVFPWLKNNCENDIIDLCIGSAIFTIIKND